MANYNPILTAPIGANKKPKRVGRGSSSGHGTTSGKGNKGQQSRSGKAGPYVGFEGGQMPLYRRLAIRGFSNSPFKKEYVCINVSSLNLVFNAGDVVNYASLMEKGFIPKTHSSKVKVLGEGELTKALTIEVDKVSKGAKDKIEKAGGSVKVFDAPSDKGNKKSKKSDKDKSGSGKDASAKE